MEETIKFWATNGYATHVRVQCQERWEFKSTLQRVVHTYLYALFIAHVKIISFMAGIFLKSGQQSFKVHVSVHDLRDHCFTSDKPGDLNVRAGPHSALRGGQFRKL